MSKLQPFLELKSQVIADRQHDFTENPAKAIGQLSARSWVGGITGTRPIRMGEYTIISDSGPGLGGNSLGPTSPELLLGALASCLVHTYLIQAALLDIPLDQVEIEVKAELDYAPVIGLPTALPPQLRTIRYEPKVSSPASAERIEAMHKAVEVSCPVLNTLRLPSPVERIYQ
jgi:uncharacterized OsmC-like protein